MCHYRTYINAESDIVHPPVRWPCHSRVLLEEIGTYEVKKVIGRGPAFSAGDWSRVVRWAADYGEVGVVSLKCT